ncbi:hypothetical protein TTHERM_01014450 (macronuclear) [Tetrahymena thermophila SB210]|uniref:Uncharacterized protein n=1 Tax=Tetrahymena thermophila (strain SB210) TaxID=312017 RepID=Q22CZ1_TETTS|nr:hypothetical protein TTHERM_01014450 [Tetrahymena thermophila SB210]EAR83128.2 hypothetical protein TTHERM_01014450 [Tetrahymena thermophila SB210]|eukprot:XP_001030791.2 hypothetical protein TTHERM_01014450 [Tetrahymena thermophila SB210]
MKIQDKYRDEFLREKSLNQIPKYRFKHGQQVYQTACIECLERLHKLNTERLNYMLQKQNVCAFILVLGLSKYFKYKDFFEFLSYVYDDGKQNNIEDEKNLELIIKFFVQGYGNLIIQRQTHLNVEQLQESDENILLDYYEQVKNEENPIGRMQELVSKHIKENIILGFSDDEILDLSFLGLFRLSQEGAISYNNKKKRKARLFQLSLPFVLFYIHEQRIFDLNETYSNLIKYKKQLLMLKQRENKNFTQSFLNDGFNDEESDSNLDEMFIHNEKMVLQIKQKMDKSPLFRDLEAKTSKNLKNQSNSNKGKKKISQSTVTSSNQQGNGNYLICSNTGKAPAFINALHQDIKIREPNLAAGILPVSQKDPAENKAIQSLVHVNDTENKVKLSDLVTNIMREPYNYEEDNNLVQENDNPKGLLLEIVMKQFKTHSCLQYKSTLINSKEFECVLLFQDNSIYTRGRANNKKGCEKIASAKMIPLIEDYIKFKELQNSKPKKVILFSTNTNQTIKKTDKINNELKNQHPQLQKIIENNLYHPNLSLSKSSSSSSSSNNNQDSRRYNQREIKQRNYYPQNNSNSYTNNNNNYYQQESLPVNNFRNVAMQQYLTNPYQFNVNINVSFQQQMQNKLNGNQPNYDIFQQPKQEQQNQNIQKNYQFNQNQI